MMMCPKCTGISGWLMLILGIIFLLVDFGVWNFWGIMWWSALFVVWGVVMLASKSCKECQAMSGHMMKK